MNLKEEKKVLFVVGMDQELDYSYVKQKYQILPEEILLVESDELDRIEPFGDLMRDILLNVYQKNIEEIVIVDPRGNIKNSEDILSIIENSLDLQNINRTLDYLFSHGNPEFSDRTIREWVEGNNRIIVDRQNIIEMIRRHPLMPISVKVSELRIGQENEKQLEIDVFKV